ncbi:MAG: hypothetical protein ACR2GF_02170 [Acidimicrobiales bacterium]
MPNSAVSAPVAGAAHAHRYRSDDRFLGHFDLPGVDPSTVDLPWRRTCSPCGSGNGNGNATSITTGATAN